MCFGTLFKFLKTFLGVFEIKKKFYTRNKTLKTAMENLGKIKREKFKLNTKELKHSDFCLLTLVF